MEARDSTDDFDELKFYQDYGVTWGEAMAETKRRIEQQQKEWLDLLDENEQRWREKNGK